MIDITNESIISMNEAARLLPPGRRGRPTTLGCILRWVLQGAKAPDGTRVRLEAVRLGGRWLTSREALQRFAEALTPRLHDEPPPRPRSQRQRDRAAERATKGLESEGI